MKLMTFLDAMEAIAPRELALDYDNPGLLIEPDREDIHRVLVALDCTPQVAREAVLWGADLVLTHHPLFFNGIKHILKDDPSTAAAYILLRNGIGLFSAHTNLDCAAGGVNDVLAQVLGLKSVRHFGEGNIGRVGELCNPDGMNLKQFAFFVEEKLHCVALSNGDGESQIRSVALIGGAGGEEWKAAQEAGADVFITGECKHHIALDAASAGMTILTCGHYETEVPVLPVLVSHLQPIENDVLYKIALADCSPQRRF